MECFPALRREACMDCKPGPGGDLGAGPSPARRWAVDAWSLVRARRRADGHGRMTSETPHLNPGTSDEACILTLPLFLSRHSTPGMSSLRVQFSRAPSHTTAGRGERADWPRAGHAADETLHRLEDDVQAQPRMPAQSHPAMLQLRCDLLPEDDRRPLGGSSPSKGLSDPHTAVLCSKSTSPRTSVCFQRRRQRRRRTILFSRMVFRWRKH